jgi:hypothetical protein
MARGLAPVVSDRRNVFNSFPVESKKGVDILSAPFCALSEKPLQITKNLLIEAATSP